MIIALPTLLYLQDAIFSVIGRIVRPYYKNFTVTSAPDDVEDEDEVFAEYDDEKGVVFFPPMYAQRYAAVSDCLMDERWAGQLEKVVDFGYNDMSFIRYIKEMPGVKTIYGVDLETISLNCSSDLLGSNSFMKRDTPLKILLFQGNAADPDYRLIGADAVVSIELIEHMLPHDLDRFVHTIFGFIQPRIAIISTPNGDFNVLFKSLEANGYRRLDHFFEWSREQFHDWCSNIVTRYPDYTVTCQGVGPGPEGTSHLGCCSQMALFISKHYRKQPELTLNSLALVARNNQYLESIDISDDTSRSKYFETQTQSSLPDLLERQNLAMLMSTFYNSYNSLNCDKMSQCNLDRDVGKSYLMGNMGTGDVATILVPRKQRNYKAYVIGDIARRLNCTTSQAKKFSKMTQNLLLRHRIESNPQTREVVDEIKYLTKMLNLNRSPLDKDDGCIWKNINWGENAPYLNEYYKMVKELTYPFAVKSTESRILDIITNEIDRLVDDHFCDDDPTTSDKLEIPIQYLMESVSHITVEVDQVKEILEWNGYELNEDIVVYSRSVQDDLADADDITEDEYGTLTEYSEVFSETKGRNIRRALDRKIQKLRSTLTVDEDISFEMERIVCRLVKMALHATKHRESSLTPLWMLCKLHDLLTLTIRSIEKKKLRFHINYQGNMLTVDNYDDNMSGETRVVEHAYKRDEDDNSNSNFTKQIENPKISDTILPSTIEQDGMTEYIYEDIEQVNCNQVMEYNHSMEQNQMDEMESYYNLQRVDCESPVGLEIQVIDQYKSDSKCLVYQNNSVDQGEHNNDIFEDLYKAMFGDADKPSSLMALVKKIVSENFNQSFTDINNPTDQDIVKCEVKIPEQYEYDLISFYKNSMTDIINIRNEEDKSLVHIGVFSDNTDQTFIANSFLDNIDFLESMQKYKEDGTVLNLLKKYKDLINPEDPEEEFENIFSESRCFEIDDLSCMSSSIYLNGSCQEGTNLEEECHGTIADTFEIRAISSEGGLSENTSKIRVSAKWPEESIIICASNEGKSYGVHSMESDDSKALMYRETCRKIIKKPKTSIYMKNRKKPDLKNWKKHLGHPGVHETAVFTNCKTAKLNNIVNTNSQAISKQTPDGTSDSFTTESETIQSIININQEQYSTISFVGSSIEESIANTQKSQFIEIVTDDKSEILSLRRTIGTEFDEMTNNEKEIAHKESFLFETSANNLSKKSANICNSEQSSHYDLDQPSTSKCIPVGTNDVQCGSDKPHSFETSSAIETQFHTNDVKKVNNMCTGSTDANHEVISNTCSIGIKIKDSNEILIEKMANATKVKNTVKTQLTSEFMKSDSKSYTMFLPNALETEDAHNNTDSQVESIDIVDNNILIPNDKQTTDVIQTPNDKQTTDVLKTHNDEQTVNDLHNPKDIQAANKLQSPKEIITSNNIQTPYDLNITYNVQTENEVLDWIDKKEFLKDNVTPDSSTKNETIMKLRRGGVCVHSYTDVNVVEDVVYQGEWQKHRDSSLSPHRHRSFSSSTKFVSETSLKKQRSSSTPSSAKRVIEIKSYSPKTNITSAKQRCCEKLNDKSKNILKNNNLPPKSRPCSVAKDSPVSRARSNDKKDQKTPSKPVHSKPFYTAAKIPDNTQIKNIEKYFNNQSDANKGNKKIRKNMSFEMKNVPMSLVPRVATIRICRTKVENTSIPKGNIKKSASKLSFLAKKVLKERNLKQVPSKAKVKKDMNSLKSKKQTLNSKAHINKPLSTNLAFGENSKNINNLQTSPTEAKIETADTLPQNPSEGKKEIENIKIQILSGESEEKTQLKVDSHTKIKDEDIEMKPLAQTNLMQDFMDTEDDLELDQSLASANLIKTFMTTQEDPESPDCLSVISMCTVKEIPADLTSPTNSQKNLKRKIETMSPDRSKQSKISKIPKIVKEHENTKSPNNKIPGKLSTSKYNAEKKLMESTKRDGQPTETSTPYGSPTRNVMVTQIVTTDTHGQGFQMLNKPTIEVCLNQSFGDLKFKDSNFFKLNQPKNSEIIRPVIDNTMQVLTNNFDEDPQTTSSIKNTGMEILDLNMQDDVFSLNDISKLSCGEISSVLNNSRDSESSHNAQSDPESIEDTVFTDADTYITDAISFQSISSDNDKNDAHTSNERNKTVIEDIFDNSKMVINETPPVTGTIAAQVFSGYSVESSPLSNDRPDPINVVDSETGSVAAGFRLTASEELFVIGTSAPDYQLEDEDEVPYWLFQIIDQDNLDSGGEHQSLIEEEDTSDARDVNGNAVEPLLGAAAGAGDGRGMHSDYSQDSSGQGSSLSTSENDDDTGSSSEENIEDRGTSSSSTIQQNPQDNLLRSLDDDSSQHAETVVAFPATLPYSSSGCDADVSSLDTDIPD